MKGGTVELDDPADLVEEEMEIFERASRESTKNSRQTLRKEMVDKETQTSDVKPSFSKRLVVPSTGPSLSLMNFDSNTRIRTLTRQLQAGHRKSVVKKRGSARALAGERQILEDNEIDAEDEFLTLEANKQQSRIRRDNVRAKLGWFKLLIYDLKTALNRQRNERTEFKLFLKTIKNIQGELGSSTAALFLFVRFLFIINLFSGFLWISFVVIPQAYFFDYGVINNKDEPFSTVQLFLGDGRVAKSWLFFNGYDEALNKWPMYFVYVAVYFVSILGVFLGILQTIGNDIVREGVVTSEANQSLAVNVFTAWDFSITSFDAIRKQEKSLQSNFIDLICELTSLQKSRTLREKRIILTMRVLAWFIWAMLVGGAITAIIVIVNKTNNTGSTELVDVYGPTVALTAINIVVPFLMQQLTHIENYDVGRSEQYVTIFRVYVMRMISLCTFIITLVGREDSSVSGCVQLYWGQEFYKLCIINTLSNVSVLLKYPAFLYLLGKKIEVDLPSSLMSLIYFQGCIWFGNMFCPLLSFMAAISNLIYFGIAAVIVKHSCTPPTKRYNSQNSKFFNSFLALTVIIMLFITCYILVTKHVTCGPYTRSKFDTMFDAFTVFAEDWPDKVRSTLKTILSAAVAVPVILVLAICIYFLMKTIDKHAIQNEVYMAELVTLRAEKAEYLREKRNRASQN